VRRAGDKFLHFFASRFSGRASYLRTGRLSRSTTWAVLAEDGAATITALEDVVTVVALIVTSGTAKLFVYA